MSEFAEQRPPATSGGPRCPVLDWDPFSAETIEPPHPMPPSTWRETPVFYAPQREVWVITRYDEVREALKDTRNFSNAFSLVAPELPAELADVLPDGWPHLPNIIIQDPPKHTGQRKVGQRGFTIAAIATHEPAFREIVDALIDGFPETGRFDLVELFCDAVMARCSWHMIGLPPVPLEWMLQCKDDALAVQEHQLVPRTPQELVAIGRRTKAFADMLEDLIDARRAEPREDVVSHLLHAHTKEGEVAFTAGEVFAFVSMVLVGGIDTTSGVLANALRETLPRRDMWARLGRDRAFASAVWEETLRARSSVRYIQRTTARPVTIGDAEIPAGAMVLLALRAANRDERAFDDPDRFLPERENPREHLGLGRGTHFCMGAALNRCVGAVSLFALAERLPDLRLVEERPPTIGIKYQMARALDLMVDRGD